MVIVGHPVPREPRLGKDARRVMSDLVSYERWGQAKR